MPLETPTQWCHKLLRSMLSSLCLSLHRRDIHGTWQRTIIRTRQGPRRSRIGGREHLVPGFLRRRSDSMKRTWRSRISHCSSLWRTVEYLLSRAAALANDRAAQPLLHFGCQLARGLSYPMLHSATSSDQAGDSRITRETSMLSTVYSMCELPALALDGALTGSGWTVPLVPELCPAVIVHTKLASHLDLPWGGFNSPRPLLRRFLGIDSYAQSVLSLQGSPTSKTSSRAPLRVILRLPLPQTSTHRIFPRPLLRILRQDTQPQL